MASHRRWHKPRAQTSIKANRKQPTTPVQQDGERSSNEATDLQEGSRFSCGICGKIFRRQAYLRKHYSAHQVFEKKSVQGSDIAEFNEKAEDLLKYTRSLDDFGDDVKLMDDALHDRYFNKRENHEFSAFSLVNSDYNRNQRPFENTDEIRDTNFNSFWNKTSGRRTFNTNYFADCENASDRSYKNYESANPNEKSVNFSKEASSISSDTEDSQTLDITGSEDETRTVEKKDAVKAEDSTRESN